MVAKLLFNHTMLNQKVKANIAFHFRLIGGRMFCATGLYASESFYYTLLKTFVIPVQLYYW